MKIIIISSSLDKKSRSMIMAEYANSLLSESGIETTLLDLRDYDIPLCDGSDYRLHKDIKTIRSTIAKSDAIIISMPIYIYSANAAARNIIEWTGRAWEEKPVAFMCAAGGQNSYMSVMSLADSLMLNFRCIILPRFVYSLSTAFDDAKKRIVSEEIQSRINQLCQRLTKIAGALKN